MIRVPMAVRVVAKFQTLFTFAYRVTVSTRGFA
jgi:hypothetical protein